MKLFCKIFRILPLQHSDTVFVGSILGSPFWEHVKEILNPETSIGAEPWVYYLIYAFFVFLFNIFDIVSANFTYGYSCISTAAYIYVAFIFILKFLSMCTYAVK